MSRSLSGLEAKLILHLEWEKQPVVTIDGAHPPPVPPQSPLQADSSPGDT
jgi:hypothetical protein